MLHLVWIAMLIVSSMAEYTANCGDDTSPLLTLEPSTDGVGGRYFMQWCHSNVSGTVNEWKFSAYVINKNPDKCHYRLLSGVLHSEITLQIDQTFNCSKVCFSGLLDLIYTGCYTLQSSVIANDISLTPLTELRYINNSYRSADYFNNSKTYTTAVSHGDELKVMWYFGYIPVLDYEVEMFCETDDEAEPEPVPLDTRRNCSLLQANVVRCVVRAAPGRYQLTFHHRAPWGRGHALPPALTDVLLTLVHNDSVPGDKAPVVDGAADGGGGGALWAAGGAALAALLLLALLVPAARAVLRRAAPPVVQKGDVALSAVPSPPPPPPGGAVLLLYARDTHELTDAVHSLGEVLQLAVPQVLDVHSPACVAQWAPAPADWLRAVLRADVKVVIIESPGLEALYCPDVEHGDRDIRLCSPLLGRRVQYRAPAPADQLVALALRLVREDAVTARPYRKYFVCTVCEAAGGGAVPTVTPLRRYVLPGGLGALLRDVGGAEPPPALLGHWAAARAAVQRAAGPAASLLLL